MTWDAAPAGSDVTRYRIYRSTSAVFPSRSGFDQFGTFTRRPAAHLRRRQRHPGHHLLLRRDGARRGRPAPTSPASSSDAGRRLRCRRPTRPRRTPRRSCRPRSTTTTSTLTWTASTSADTAGYEVFRADTAGGTPTKISSAGLTGTTFTDSDRPRGTTSYYTVRALDTASNQSVPSNTATATVEAAGVDLSYVFQPDAAAVPAGYTKDIGSAFSLATGRGWVTQSSLSSATHTPIDFTRQHAAAHPHGRDRPAEPPDPHAVRRHRAARPPATGTSPPAPGSTCSRTAATRSR